ncbi:MAG: hypothetical protein ACJ8FS_17100 [Sphingomicrobium sp.]
MAVMAIDKEIARLSKILVDTDGILFPEAEARLRSLKLEVAVGEHSASPAAHAAVLTAASVGRRTFLGGVRVVGNLDQPLLTALPIEGPTLGKACAAIGARKFDGEVSFRITVGQTDADRAGPHAAVASWWDGWDAGVRRTGGSSTGDGSNPLAGIVAGALAVGCGFDSVRGKLADLPADIHLWGLRDPPAFAHVFLPGAIWIVGLGNLGQAFSWALASMPYAQPRDVQLILHDFDRVSEENWGTSVLVPDGMYGRLKTKLVEQWLDRRGFSVRRVDRRLLPTDRLVEGEPRLAFSGLDKIAARRDMASVGFGSIIDAGLGRTAHDFDRFRVTVFHADRPIGAYFAGMEDATPGGVPRSRGYQLLAEDDRCGAAEIAGASVAVPHVSAVAAAVALARMIAVVTGQSVPASTVRRTSAVHIRRGMAAETPDCPGILHAGRPQALGAWPEPFAQEN